MNITGSFDMAIVNRKYGYVYLAEPHTGSRACLKALQQHEGFEHNGSHHEKADLTADGLTTFSVVRHPLEIITTYFHHDKRNFFEVVLAHVKRSRDPGFYYHAATSDRLLRYENGLSKEVNNFFESIGAPPVDFEITRPTAGKRDWWEYFDDITIRIVEVLLPEIKVFGYTTKKYWKNVPVPRIFTTREEVNAIKRFREES
jgi:hypothetical protein